MIRVAFFGSPQYAVPSLGVLVTDPQFDLALVVTQPDRGAGRGRAPRESAVGRFARELDLPLYKTGSLRSPEARAPLAAAKADVFLVAAFGLIFGPATLAMPRFGCLNLHASLLPRYRGASPVQATILAGDEISGVTLMEMDRGLDTGRIVAIRQVEIGRRETADGLAAKLSVVAADLTRLDVEAFCSGAIQPIEQPTREASLTRPLTKADGFVDWSASAAAIERQVRAMWPWPRAWSVTSSVTVQIHDARVHAQFGFLDSPGKVVPDRNRLLVACGTGALELVVVQPQGRPPMAGPAFVAGRHGGEIQFGGANVVPDLPPLIVPIGANGSETEEHRLCG